MNNEQRTMNNAKSGKRWQRIPVFSFFLFTFSFFTLIGCDHFSAQPGNNTQIESGYGRISVLMPGIVGGETARTVFPQPVFDEFVYTFTRVGDGSVSVLTPDSEGFFILEAGTYTVEVKAFIGSGEPYTLVASGVSEEFTVDSGATIPVSVRLFEVDAGQGTFSYTITYPDDAEILITLKKWPELNYVELNPATEGNRKSETFELDAGSYLLSIQVYKDERYAGKNEAIHIYPELTTEYVHNFTEGDLLAGTSGLDFQLINGGTAYRVRAGAVTGGDIVIPAYHRLDADSDYLPVTEIGKMDDVYGVGAFLNTAITSVTIPETVRFIGAGAFEGCNDLTDIIIPDSVTSIGDAAIYGCVNLANITIGSGVMFINDWAFFGCTSLAGIIIPDSVTTIGQEAFGNCTNLESITIPSSVTTICDGAFTGCAGLASITVADGNLDYESDSGILYNKGKTSLIKAPPAGISVSVTIPASVETIVNYAFSGCTNLTGITISTNVMSIGNNVFQSCTNLKNITINTDKVTTTTSTNWRTIFSDASNLSVIFNANIGAYAFYSSSSNTKLTSVTVGPGVTSIGNSAFEGCNGLTAITADPANGNYTSQEGILYNKAKTEIVIVPRGISGSVTIPEDVMSIPSQAFRNCTSLTSITIPNSVTTIGSSAFLGCTGLISITLPFVGNTKVEVWDANNYFGFIFSQNNIPASLKTVIITGGSIRERAFIDAKDITSITFGEGVTSIGEQAFYFDDSNYCTNLTSVTFEGIISSSNFSSSTPFYGDLRAKYLDGGIGTYKRDPGGNVWTKVDTGTPNVWTAVPDSTVWDFDAGYDIIKFGIKAIAYGNGMFVAGSEMGKMAYSDDGETWTPATTSYDAKNINAIAYDGNGRFVAVCDYNQGNITGLMLTSSDGKDWTSVSHPDHFTAIYAVAYGGGRFVAGAVNGYIGISTDGEDWTWNKKFDTTESINAIAYGDNKFVATFNGKIATSTGGENWELVTDSTLDTVTYINDIIYGGGKFVAVGDKIATSIDGENWELVKDSTFDFVISCSIAYGNNKFVTVWSIIDFTIGDFVGKMMYSIDSGVTWTEETNSTFGTTPIHSIIHAKDKFIAGGDDGKMAYLLDD